tara:strand:+ start:40739 stop:41095 length:357 start_codon:yes stop_codon:yes gene_type:complete
MNNKKSIIFLFIFGCFLARTMIAYTAYIITIKYLNYLPLAGYVGLIISLGFAYNIVMGRNKGAFNQRVWWQNYRYIHSLIFFIFALLAINKNQEAYKLLFLDALLGLLFFMRKRLLNF